MPRSHDAPPVEYAVAVDRYLSGAALGSESRRIYRISLTSWAWPLVGKRLPQGALRRGAAPPVVPLALLDDPAAAGRLAAAIADRAAVTDARTVNRELSALRSAVGWWREQQWIRADPTAGLQHLAGTATMLPALSDSQVVSLFRAPAGLREQAFWRVLYDSAARPEEVLALDAVRLDLASHRGRIEAPREAGPAWDAAAWIKWRSNTTDLLRWLLAGRAHGPVFLTDRRAPARAAAANVCPITGRARMSYRRAAEIFTASTRPLDPAGRAWTLHQLHLAGIASRAGRRAGTSRWATAGPPPGRDQQAGPAGRPQRSRRSPPRRAAAVRGGPRYLSWARGSGPERAGNAFRPMTVTGDLS